VHIHISAVGAAVTMVYIALLGTLWRLLAAHAIASKNATLSGLGHAMLFQY
jgi:hypothetical protein